MLQEIDFALISHLYERRLRKNFHEYEIWYFNACLNSSKFHLEINEG